MEAVRQGGVINNPVWSCCGGPVHIHNSLSDRRFDMRLLK